MEIRKITVTECEDFVLAEERRVWKLADGVWKARADEIGKTMDRLVETAYCGTFREKDLEKYIRTMKKFGFDSKLKKKFGIE